MRSSSLKVYSPVEYTGYKEKRSGHPSEPGSRTGNRKTTRKPKPILYRLRRFCKRLNWKRIGGLAVTTVVIVFAARGVVGMFSEHTQTKTAPVTTSSPAAEESQPYVFYYKDGQAVSWEDVTDAWAAEAGIQKRYALTDAERLEIAQVLTAEAGGEPFAGKIAVAQCILQTCEDEGISRWSRDGKDPDRPQYVRPCQDRADLRRRTDSERGRAGRRAGRLLCGRRSTSH